jgi:hypothetical protein
VRVLRGSTPTAGSHSIQSTSPRRISIGSRVVIVQQIELSGFDFFEEQARIVTAGGVITGELSAPFPFLAAQEALTQNLPR